MDIRNSHRKDWQLRGLLDLGVGGTVAAAALARRHLVVVAHADEIGVLVRLLCHRGVVRVHKWPGPVVDPLALVDQTNATSAYAGPLRCRRRWPENRR